jgi:hypothetical protein
MSILTATVTLGTGSITVTPSGGTAIGVVGGNIMDVQIFSSQIQPFLNLPTYIDDTVFPPGTPYEAMNPASVQWYVKVVFIDERYLDLPMGRITNQGTWVNTGAGAEIARAAILAAAIA